MKAIRPGLGVHVGGIVMTLAERLLAEGQAEGRLEGKAEGKDEQRSMIVQCADGKVLEKWIANSTAELFI